MPSLSAPDKDRASQVPLRLRAILIGALLIPPNSFWVIYMERVVRGPYPTTISLFANVLFILLLLVIVNRFLHRYWPKGALNQAELLTIYTMLGVSSALAGLDMIPSLIIKMGHPFRYASESNRWEALFFHHLQPMHWLMVKDLQVLEPYYRGNSSLYHWEYLSLWIPPILAWVGFILLLFWVLQCLCILVRRQWVDRERLSFPIVQLPFVMTLPEGGLFRQPLLWLGFALAGGIDLINGFAFLFPSIPSIPIWQRDLSPNFRVRPWSAMGWTPIAFYPFAIGLGYLLPADLLFSCWFFFLFWKAQRIFSAALAWDAIPRFPFINEQCFGAYSGLILVSLWTGRKYFLEIGREIFSPFTVGKGGREEALSYRVAFWGFLIGWLGLLLFCRLMGMSWGISFLFFLLYLILAISVARMRAELGPPVHDLHFTGPDHLLPTFLGTKNLGGTDLAGFTLFFWFNRAYRSHPVPFQIEGLKLAQLARTSQQRTLGAVLLAILLGSFSAFWAFLHFAYQLGTAAKINVGTSFAWEAYNRLASWLSNPTDPDYRAMWAVGVGFFFTLGLMILRLRLLWFPFHPLGYAISGSWSMNLVWMCLLIAWIVKVLVLRFGGLRAYRQFLPFFFGLILGQTVVGCLWSLVGLILGIPTYSFWGA